VAVEAETGRPVVRLLELDGESTGLIQLLSDMGVGTEIYASIREFESHGRPDVPGCVVVDARLFFTADAGASALPRSLSGNLPMIVVSPEPDVATVVRAMKAGAVDFLQTPFREELMLQAISVALQTDRKRRALETRHAELRARFATLTPRERQVMALVTAGRLNKQIAFDLGLSEITIKVHRGSVMRKTQVRSLAELVRMADTIRDLGGWRDSNAEGDREPGPGLGSAQTVIPSQS
jgi:FixJ family two-component response regulator